MKIKQLNSFKASLIPTYTGKTYLTQHQFAEGQRF